jgi:hypothetical protein
MANKIKLRRSYTAGAVPLTTDLETNEVAINYADGKLFVKTPQNTIQAITLGGSGSIPTASASVLGGVKVGSGLTITDGVLAATGGSLSGSVTIPASGDTQWPNTVILLKGDDGLLQDATGRAWTAVGSPSVSTSVKKFGSSSLAFPNSPLSYLSTARTSQLEVGTGDFTLEWWLHPTAYPSGTAGQYNSSIFGTRGDNGAASGLICVMNPAGKLAFFMDGGSQTWGLFAGTTLTTSAIPLNEWTHIALTRSGSTWRGFYNGQLEVTVTQSGTPSVGIGNITIGGDDSGERFVGYMDDVRYTRAVRYTSTFTPPTATYVTGTYAAAQTYPVTITGSGGGGGSGLTWSSVPASATASGTAGQIAYDGNYLYVATAANTWERAALSSWATDPSFSNVSLLLHMDGLGSAFVDSSGTPKTITTSGNATQSAAQSVFGGRSAYFDGSGDSIQTPTVGQSALQFSNQLHTVEFWFRTNSTTQYTCLFYRGREGVETAYDYVININNVSSSSGDIYLFSLGLGGAALGSSINGLNDNNWHHLAVCRDSGNVIRMYIDGVQRASMTYDMTQSYSANSDSIIRIGRDGVLTGRDFIGNIDELRITTGVCRYPNGTTFTPPTAPFPDA